MPKHLYEDEALAQEVYQEEKDSHFARQVEQEIRDEDLARQLARAEERALAAEERARGPPPTHPWTPRRVCSYIVPMVIVMIGIVALLYAVRKDETETIPSLPNFGAQFFEDEDPWEGLKPGDVVKWSNGGSGGLHLEVIDALQSQWEDIFHDVINDWGSGTPKTLQLSTEKAGHDPECEPLDNKSKVCNGNYGDTQWRGINQVLIQNGYIVATTSKMNDFYLSDASVAQKRYTMCHEVGHSFGLPHTDEDFFNPDLGNCMDYTSNPFANISPDESNFMFLEDLYGTIPARRTLKLRRKAALTQMRITDEVREKLRNAVRRLENGVDGNSQHVGWRRLQRSRKEEIHTMSLGNGWTVQVNKLLKLEENN